jgi:hypothetical protein
MWYVICDIPNRCSWKTIPAYCKACRTILMVNHVVQLTMLTVKPVVKLAIEATDTSGARGRARRQRWTCKIWVHLQDKIINECAWLSNECAWLNNECAWLNNECEQNKIINECAWLNNECTWLNNECAQFKINNECAQFKINNGCAQFKINNECAQFEVILQHVITFAGRNNHQQGERHFTNNTNSTTSVHVHSFCQGAPWPCITPGQCLT